MRPVAPWPRAEQRTPAPRWHRVRGLVAALSVAVFLATGAGWAMVGGTSGLTTADVTGPHVADGATDILLVGSDSRVDARGNPLPREVLDALDAGDADGQDNTDTLMLVRIPDDPDLGASAVSIPRDSWVDVPGLGMHKINSALARGAAMARPDLVRQGLSGPDLERAANAAGSRLLVRTVEELTGVSIDHYAQVNLAGFADITRALGGVPVCLKAPVHDSYSGADFAAGPQTVQGARALQFVRQRHGLPEGDLDRVRRQQAFLAGLTHRLLSAGTLTDPTAVADLMQAINGAVVLDQGWDLTSMLAHASQLRGDRVTFRTIPTGRADYRTGSEGVAVKVDPAQVTAFFAGLTAPGAPADPGAGDDADTAAPTPSSPAPATTESRTGRAAAPRGDPTPAADTQPELTADGVPCVD
ncbi:Cell envelope-associated transcriptional attenuator LytR-CpsA-Psr, subfamily A1 [Pseudonocardia sp. Ae717_Ps2]|uniref:LCP family protein n=1 Tax=unclassified Pseudonocardia TaxID=2619320 RepID=UPI00095D5C5B|nr:MULTISPECIES: LCP family protein [unclassified Pseudonocardia]OLM13647.1 Cell envelope-associated transcriptional attenuator LytR-CpsA-Psr, subfamily A1 [Pseudonocardia sp. Ae505_Ps2]OLM30774.1 Cell envelope-associated transcriptional attenuator LytR-CpsA-Psr, subfamily A1 [Pseudonocardia sp. Ae717_Ps2]